MSRVPDNHPDRFPTLVFLFPLTTTPLQNDKVSVLASKTAEGDC
ncbi:unnamed protein product [Lasius platythorax]|uniref:Uncharacterized protein n=1 Tax=Lasius platythorax TaxID=488582 RepID=A0AAV2NA57_9HYME